MRSDPHLAAFVAFVVMIQRIMVLPIGPMHLVLVKVQPNDQAVAALDVHAAPDVHQVSILTVHSHRRVERSRRLHGFDTDFVLSALLFPTSHKCPSE